MKNHILYGTLVVIFAIICFFAFYKTVGATPNMEWSSGTYKLQDKLINLGYSDDVSKMMINQCKEHAKDPRNCVVTAAFIGKAESSSCTKQINNNCWGLRNHKFDTKTQAFQRWLKSYNKYWFRHLKPKDFYGRNSKTAFCVDEHSSRTYGWCPNGLETANHAYKFINK